LPAIAIARRHAWFIGIEVSLAQLMEDFLNDICSQFTRVEWRRDLNSSLGLTPFMLCGERVDRFRNFKMRLPGWRHGAENARQRERHTCSPGGR
jgi:hypothetical protein